MSDRQRNMLHPVFNEAMIEGVEQHKQNLKAIPVLSGIIAEMMEELHGGDWKVQIDHEVGLIAISQNFNAEASA